MNTEFKKFLKLSGTGAQAAKSIGVSPTQISQVVRGHRRVPPAMAKRIVDEYPNINLYHLLFG